MKGIYRWYFFLFLAIITGSFWAVLPGQMLKTHLITLRPEELSLDDWNYLFQRRVWIITMSFLSYLGTLLLSGTFLVRFIWSRFNRRRK